MDWVPVFNAGGPIVALLVGGLIGRRKTKADSHSVVVADAVLVATKAREDAATANAGLHDALRRINDLEERENRRDDLARQHLRWDWRQVRKLADFGIDVEDPPPLFLYTDDVPTKGN